MKIVGKTDSCRTFVYLFITAILIDFLRGDAFAPRQEVRRGRRRSAGRYDKRSVSSLPGTVIIQALKNVSFMMCSEAMALPSARMVQLDDDNMRAYLQGQGGNYVKDYMAATPDEAVENFPNMVALTKPTTVDGSDSSFSMGDNIVAKQTIIDDLNKLTAYLKASGENETDLPDGGSLGSVHSGHTDKPFTANTISSEVRNQSKNNTSSLTGSKRTTVSASLQRESITATSYHNISSVSSTTDHSNINSAPQNSVNESSTQTPIKETIMPSTTATSVSKRPPTSADNTRISSTFTGETTTKTSITSNQSTLLNQQTTEPSTLPPVPPTSSVTAIGPDSIRGTMATKRTTLDPLVKTGLEELLHYVQGSDAKRELDTIWRNANTTLHPATLLGLATGSGRTKRNADGSYTREDYCQKKGSLTEDRRYVHLCTKCAATTRLSEDMFPRYINEAVCKTGDTDCFTIAGTSHGQCKQTKFSLNMLRKKRGICHMLLHGAETLVFERWELVQQTIRVSCECTINKLSVFSQYAAHDVPVG